MNWLIGIGGSDLDDVITYRVTGDKEQVKRHLRELVKEAVDEDRENLDYADTLKTIKADSNGVFHAGACFSDYHRDYTATPEMEPIVLK